MQSASPIHTASLVDASLHPPALLELLDTKLYILIDYIINSVVDIVNHALSYSALPSSGHFQSRLCARARLGIFANQVLRKARVQAPVLLVTLVYLHRVRNQLHIGVEQWVYERVFLGAMILAHKYTNDLQLSNLYWALCIGVVGPRDIGCIEREFLDVLDFQLGFTEADILIHREAIMALVKNRSLATHNAGHPAKSPYPHPNSVRDRHKRLDISLWSPNSSDTDSSSSS